MRWLERGVLNLRIKDSQQLCPERVQISGLDRGGIILRFPPVKVVEETWVSLFEVRANSLHGSVIGKLLLGEKSGKLQSFYQHFPEIALQVLGEIINTYHFLKVDF